MRLSMRRLLTVAVALAALPVAPSAHFRLLEPASWITEDKLGDPQKLGPCGGDPKGQNDPLLTRAITKVVGGAKLHLKMQETIYHSGHYRVALAVNSWNELPPDPMTFEKYTDKGIYSVWAAIQSPPQIPVLADGLFQHYPAEGTALLDAAEDADGSLGNRRPDPEYHLPEVHAAGASIHGRSRLQPAGWLCLPSLRGSPDHG